MPKPHTFPTLFDDALQLNLTKLKEWGYLESERWQSGTVSWSRNDHPRGSISISVNMHSKQPYIELDYKFKEEPRQYKVLLVSVPSNLGNGKVWYFLCPITKKRCRKLYSIGGYFLHREAFNGCMYESQTYTKKWRLLNKVYGSYFDSDKLYLELYSKHLKKTYKGKPTKRYKKLLSKINQANSIPIKTIEELIIM